MRRGVVGIAALFLLAACGIKGAPPQPKDPSPVADLRVEGRDGAVRLSWRGRTAGGVTAFDVLRKLDRPEAGHHFEKIGSVAPAGTRTYHYFDRAPAEGASYVYRIRPRRIDPEPSEIRYSGPQGVFRWGAPLDAPTDVTSVPLNAGARLAWNPVPGADGYRVYALRADKSAKEEPVNRGLIDKTSWVAVALADGKALCYVVRAVKLPEALAEARASVPIPGDEMEAPTGAEVGDAAAVGLVIPRGNAGREISRATSELAGEGPLPGVESPSSEETCVTPGLTEPPPPPKLVRSVIVTDGLSLSWKKSPGEEVVGYHVERRETTKDGTPIDALWQRLTDGKPVTSVGFTDKTVEKGKSYEYRVRAIDAASSEGPASSPTKHVQFNP